MATASTAGCSVEASKGMGNLAELTKPRSCDGVVIHGLQVVARHGVMPEEAVLAQRFVLNIDCRLDLHHAGLADDIAATVSYCDLIAVATQALTTRRYKLIEAAASAVAEELLDAFPRLVGVIVELKKPSAPIQAIFEHVAVVIERRRADTSLNVGG